MEDKYYTPDISEFHVGFECDSNYCLVNRKSYLGGGLYHIGNGAYCNRKGFDEFERELIVQLDTYMLRWTPKIGLNRLSNAKIRKIKRDINGK